MDPKSGYRFCKDYVGAHTLNSNLSQQPPFEASNIGA